MASGCGCVSQRSATRSGRRRSPSLRGPSREFHQQTHVRRYFGPVDLQHTTDDWALGEGVMDCGAQELRNPANRDLSRAQMYRQAIHRVVRLRTYLDVVAIPQRSQRMLRACIHDRVPHSVHEECEPDRPVVVDLWGSGHQHRVAFAVALRPRHELEGRCVSRQAEYIAPVRVVRAPRIQHTLREHREQPATPIVGFQVREPKKRQKPIDVTSITDVPKTVAKLIMFQQADRADFARLGILPGDDQGAVGLAFVRGVRQARVKQRENSSSSLLRFASTNCMAKLRAWSDIDGGATVAMTTRNESTSRSVTALAHQVRAQGGARSIA